VSERRILVASNRGPVAFVKSEGGELVPKRGSGGLVTGLGPSVGATGGLWVANAMGEGDRLQAGRSPGGRLDVVVGEAKYALRLISSEPETYDRFYNGVSNRILWFLHHQLWDVSRLPVFDDDSRVAWRAYREVNVAFARALAEEAGEEAADVLVQDYHLSLVPSALRALAPRARIAHFHHTPFAGPDYLRLVPVWMRDELLTGLLGADVLGFQTARWAESFLSACRLLEGARVDDRGRSVRWEGRTIRVGVYPVTVDPVSLEELAATDDVRSKRRRLGELVGGRRLVLKVDRTEPSKNVLRGLRSFDELLKRYPEWLGKVVLLVLLNPSREDLPEYRSYTEECLRAAELINARTTDQGEDPVVIRVEDDYAEVVAAFGLYDVLLVNPILDGMNLVAKEGPLLNGIRGVVVLSRNAGAFDELGPHTVPVDPLDVTGTADALDAALRLLPEERERRARGLHAAITARSPADWVEQQLLDLAGGRAA
jgi:trehalose 6-phosphate synthase